MIHILFNVLGSVWAIILFRPFIRLVDLVAGGSTVAQHIALMHTTFNVINALLFAPFTKRFTALVERLLKARPGEESMSQRLEYVAAPLMDSPELNLMRAQKEISDMARLCGRMFRRFRELLKDRPADLADDVEAFKNMENYADQMREELSKFLMDCAAHEMGPASQANIGTMLRMVTDLEDITDDCCSLIMLLDKSRSRKLSLDEDEVESLGPYTLLVENFLGFVEANINVNISQAQLDMAQELEDKIDEFRSVLKKKARKRLQAGADVKSELLYIDVVRHIEKIGDRAYGLSRALKEMK